MVAIRKSAAALRKDLRNRSREAVTEKRDIRRQIGLAHAKAMADFEAATAHLRKQVDKIDATIDDLREQIDAAEDLNIESVLTDMGLAVGKIKVTKE